MEDSKWLDLCIQRGHLNQTDVKKWIATRSEQIRVSFNQFKQIKLILERRASFESFSSIGYRSHLVCFRCIVINWVGFTKTHYSTKTLCVSL
jgi:hypothetical protein